MMDHAMRTNLLGLFVLAELLPNSSFFLFFPLGEKKKKDELVQKVQPQRIVRLCRLLESTKRVTY